MRGVVPPAATTFTLLARPPVVLFAQVVVQRIAPEGLCSMSGRHFGSGYVFGVRIGGVVIAEIK